MKQYTTHEVAQIIGIHDNTVRFYEACGFVTKPERKPNGYRIFTAEHLLQFKVARALFQVELLQKGLRKTALKVVKLCAAHQYHRALSETEHYMNLLKSEMHLAHEAVVYTTSLLEPCAIATQPLALKRKAVAEKLAITVDTLRNWELNGLLHAKRLENGYRIYDAEDLKRLSMIRALRNANYSIAAILRLFNAVERCGACDVSGVLETPNTEEVISACDRLVSSLEAAEIQAQKAWQWILEWIRIT